MIDTLLGAIAAFYRVHADPGVATTPAMVAEVLVAIDTARGEGTSVGVPALGEPDHKPVVRHLDAIGNEGRDDSGNTEVVSIVNEFLAIAKTLPWSQTTGYLDVLSAHYLANYGYVRLIGPESVVEHDSVRVGIGLWGPHLDYPMHEHPAEELYHVLHGEPEFRTDTTEFSRRAIGEAVHHAPWTRHAQRFGESPTLLLYAWTGDILPDARIVS